MRVQTVPYAESNQLGDRQYVVPKIPFCCNSSFPLCASNPVFSLHAKYVSVTCEAKPKQYDFLFLSLCDVGGFFLGRFLIAFLLSFVARW